MILLDQVPTNQRISTTEEVDPVWSRWFTRLVILFNTLQATGTTAQRPNPAPFVGFRFFDTTLGYPVWWNGSSWIMAAQAAGITAARPNPAPYVGFMYYDTTLNRPVWAKTTNTWVFSDGLAA